MAGVPCSNQGGRTILSSKLHPYKSLKYLKIRESPNCQESFSYFCPIASVSRSNMGNLKVFSVVGGQHLTVAVGAAFAVFLLTECNTRRCDRLSQWHVQKREQRDCTSLICSQTGNNGDPCADSNPCPAARCETGIVEAQRELPRLPRARQRQI